LRFSPIAEMTMNSKVVFIGSVLSVALTSWTAFAQNASVVTLQDLDGKTVDNGGVPYVNAVTVNLNITTPTAENHDSGDDNLQSNDLDAPPTADGADATVSQSLRHSRFNADSANSDPGQVRNSADVGVTVTGDAFGNAALNAAAGAFNLQANSAAIAMVPTGELADSMAVLSQFTLQDFAVQHDTTNELTTNIVLEDVSGNLGINVATGAGNTQANTAAIATQF
jgi:hypothetical protein